MDRNELWKSLNQKSRSIETDMDSLDRKRTGSYYTDLSLTDVMMEELVETMQVDKKRITSLRFLEPCVGAGNFVFSYINKIHNKYKLTREEGHRLIDNIYVSDINSDAIEGYKSSLKKLVMELWSFELSEGYFDSHIGSGLLVDVSAEELDYIPLEKVFPPEIADLKFDIVVTNPPYKNLKAERGHYRTDEEYEADQGKYSSIAKIVSKRFKYSIDGVLNLYKLFVEEIIDRYANKNAYVSLLIPASIMSDKTCEKIRSHMLKDMDLISVKMIGEGSGYIDAQQALSTVLIRKDKKTTMVRVVKDFCCKPKDYTEVRIEDILNENTGNAIVALTKDEYIRLKKLRMFPVVKDLNFIINLRGELDLTANKKSITTTDTGYPLLRGRNIGYYELIESNEKDYALEEFVVSTKKKRYIESERIICQQIANMHKERRVTFSFVPANHVLGNSCNFISVMDNEFGIDIYTILGLFNTKIINWLFKLTSSNNHINNYEIDCFPIPIGSPYLNEISQKVQLYLSNHDATIIDMIEILAEKAYGIMEEVEVEKMTNNTIAEEYCENLTYVIPGIEKTDAEEILKGESDISSFIEEISEFNKKVIEGITEKYKAMYHGYILNHTTFKLSDLDLEMIKSVPQGGSWKDIPLETVRKSKRLEKITQTGGRTTLYGRIDYNKPSYTITTYFNRPGNGTYVHPIHERVLSVREAARFQTFKDDYYFFGNKTQLLKQVGNAVPTVLAYQIGRSIVEKTGCTKAIDLFCGAGGMTAGFKAAGISSLLSNDIEESACITLKINNPEIPILCGDIADESTKAAIEEAAKDGGAEIICGGPPCQGFSLAGFRADDDPRNQLFREFVDIVKRVNPKIIVFENVEGLLSYKKGKTYREVHTLFSELGYKTEGRSLMANDYAVPQRRKRVIIICTRNDLGIEPSELYPKETTKEKSLQATAKETISDLENVECSDTAEYISGDESDVMMFLKGEISYENYVKGRSTKASSKEKFSDLIIDDNGQLAFGV